MMASQRSDSELVKKIFLCLCIRPHLDQKVIFFPNRKNFRVLIRKLFFFETKEDILKRPELQRKNVELVVGVVELVQ